MFEKLDCQYEPFRHANPNSLCKNINLLIPVFFHHIALETINDTEDNEKNEK